MRNVIRRPEESKPEVLSDLTTPTPAAKYSHGDLSWLGFCNNLENLRRDLLSSVQRTHWRAAKPDEAEFARRQVMNLSREAARIAEFIESTKKPAGGAS